MGKRKFCVCFGSGFLMVRVRFCSGLVICGSNPVNVGFGFGSVRLLTHCLLLSSSGMVLFLMDSGCFPFLIIIFGKVGRNAPEEVLFALIKSKCLPILFFMALRHVQ